VVPKSFSYAQTKISSFGRIGMVCQPKLQNQRRNQVVKLDTDSLAHTKWNCKYHIVFAPKYRRQVIYGKIKADIDPFTGEPTKEGK
jgi:putative transposase